MGRVKGLGEKRKGAVCTWRSLHRGTKGVRVRGLQNEVYTDDGYILQLLRGVKDSDFLFPEPLLENQAANSWTLYDVRAHRENFSKYGKVDPELERMISGYDFVVLIPDPKPSHDLE
jgi:hypothetical protein